MLGIPIIRTKVFCGLCRGPLLRESTISTNFVNIRTAIGWGQLPTHTPSSRRDPPCGSGNLLLKSGGLITGYDKLPNSTGPGSITLTQ